MIEAWSGLRMLLNRMADALTIQTPAKDWDGLRLITKTTLGCSEALLVLEGRYHFSYAERGRRFKQLAQHLNGRISQAEGLPDLVKRATEFKLRPALERYPGDASEVWSEVKQACDVTFRYAAAKYLGMQFGCYAELPALYKDAMLSESKLHAQCLPMLPAPLSQNSFVSLRYVHDKHRIPWRALWHLSYPSYQIVYSLVPLGLLGEGPADLNAAREWLGKVVALDARRENEAAEWRYLRQQIALAWKDLCYGLWETI